AGHRLARTRLADQPERLAGIDRERHLVDRAHCAPARDDVGRQVLDLEQGWRHQIWRSFGSRRSRSQSPSRLKLNTTSRIARPGKNDTHHAVVMNSRPSATIEPQAGVGGGMPAPRNDSAASTMMTSPTCRVNSTTTVLRMLGNRCTAMMRAGEQPATRANA